MTAPAFEPEKMKRTIRTYRILFVVAFFAIANIGVPVVLASCPMAAETGQLCGMCPTPEKAKALQLSKIQGKSCCETVVVGERNTGEFLSSVSLTIGNISQDCASTFIGHSGYTSSALHLLCFKISYLPHAGDIPISISSLRI
jgi:hypothetical protein